MSFSILQRVSVSKPVDFGQMALAESEGDNAKTRIPLLQKVHARVHCYFAPALLPSFLAKSLTRTDLLQSTAFSPIVKLVMQGLLYGRLHLVSAWYSSLKQGR